MGGASAPTLFGRIAAIQHKGVRPEGLPTASGRVTPPSHRSHRPRTARSAA
ncbi:DUF6053 domain-containing protein [Lysobacter enzymogenes]|uniref:DUF6053 domain-containing protein n=1 Tax=Lysobacter enzymogenes TaxID=69 RepID=UPI003CCDD32B